MPEINPPVHPGKILNKQFLIPKSVTITQFSDQTGISSQHIKDFIMGKRAVSKTTADILAKHLNTNPEFWIDLQSAYDMHVARKLLKGIIPDDDALEKFMIHQPHDKLIKIVFSDRNEAVEFFKQNMPTDLVSQIIAHLLIQSHFHGKFTDIFHLLLDYFNQIKEAIGINYTKVFFIYMATTQPHEDVKHFLNVMRKEEHQKGGEHMIRILDELRLEGRLEGRQEGQLEGELKGQIAIIENMLTVQLDWQSIHQLTGIDYQQFEDMKTKLQQFQINPVVAEQAMSKSHKNHYNVSLTKSS